MSEPITNRQKKKIEESHIIELHKVRKNMLELIKNGAQHQSNNEIETYKQAFEVYIHEDGLQILNRIQENQLRSFKNMLLSHNSLYAFSAEEGGLSAVESHYQSEKYAVMIEYAQTMEELLLLHDEYFEFYAYSNRHIDVESDKLSVRIDRLIEQQFMSDLSIKHIADELYMSESYMMRRYKIETDKTIHDKIEEVRMREATQLLEKSYLSISEISYKVGYNSSQYFSRAFKKIWQMTPFEYRIKSQESAHF